MMGARIRKQPFSSIANQLKKGDGQSLPASFLIAIFQSIPRNFDQLSFLHRALRSVWKRRDSAFRSGQVSFHLSSKNIQRHGAAIQNHLMKLHRIKTVS